MTNRQLFEDLGFPAPCKEEMDEFDKLCSSLNLAYDDSHCGGSNFSTPHASIFFDETPVPLRKISFYEEEIDEGLQKTKEENSMMVDEGDSSLSDQSEKSSSEASEETKKEQKVPKKKKITKKQKKEKKNIKSSQTKNILTTFKRTICDYIRKNLPDVDSASFKEFDESKSASMKIYENLFNDESLRPTLARMFLTEELKRGLQLSRANFAQKCIYFGQISVFKRAFLKKQFTYIR